MKRIKTVFDLVCLFAVLAIIGRSLWDMGSAVANVRRRKA